MNTLKELVKMVLMSILTAATFLGIASCSNNQENIANSSDEQDNAISISENGRAWGFSSTPVLDKGKEAKKVAADNNESKKDYIMRLDALQQTI